MRTIVLLSGGIDSTVCAMMAGNVYGFDRLVGLSFVYGQKHSKESVAAKEIADKLGFGGFETVEIPSSIFKEAGSALIDENKAVPLTPYPDELGPVPTYVPFRNGTFISIAAAIALRYNASSIYFGAHAEDAMNWAYPDCTPEFLGAMKNATWVGTYHKVRLITPLEWLTKDEIVEIGHKLGAPFEFTWSCYQGNSLACGKCATCISRLQAFRANGLKDPISYETDTDDNSGSGRHV